MKTGKLRFKSRASFKTFTYNQTGFRLLPKNDKFCLLYLSKIGEIPVRLHREIKGEIKQVTIKKMSSGNLYAFIDINDGSDDFTPIDIENAVGIDVGLEHFSWIVTVTRLIIQGI